MDLLLETFGLRTRELYSIIEENIPRRCELNQFFFVREYIHISFHALKRLPFCCLGCDFLRGDVILSLTCFDPCSNALACRHGFVFILPLFLFTFYLHVVLDLS